jgi:divalent metal cation (Fe/Co/Zn/Cd) transporter
MTTLADPRLHLERRARRLAWGGSAWHLVEFAIAIGAGVSAGSVALVAFGIDSLIEFAAGGVIVWLFSGGRGASESAERRAQQMIAVSFVGLAVYVLIESVRAFTGAHPDPSWVGIAGCRDRADHAPARTGQAASRARAGVARHGERGQPEHAVCLPVGRAPGRLGANALLGWWWADPLAGLVIAVAAVQEGREAWRGEGCGDDCC